MEMVNIGPVKSYAEAYRAIRFLARFSCTPINFFGIDPAQADGNQPWITFDKRRHEHLFKQNKIGIGLGVSELAGALETWRLLDPKIRKLKRINKTLCERVSDLSVGELDEDGEPKNI